MSAGELPDSCSRANGSLANSISRLGYEFEWIKDESDFDKAEVSVAGRMSHGHAALASNAYSDQTHSAD